MRDVNDALFDSVQNGGSAKDIRALIELGANPNAIKIGFRC